MRSTPCLLGFVLTLMLTVPAAAQTVGGTYTDTGTGEPLEGAVVLLVSEAGDQVAGTLSRSDGSFIVLAPAPGRYRLEGRLIGYETVRTSYFAVARGEVAERSLSARVRAIGLEGLTAEVRPRCEARPDATGAGQRLWDEARAALEAVSLTHDAEAIRFEARRWAHDLDAETGRPLRTPTQPLSSRPYRSPRNADGPATMAGPGGALARAAPGPCCLTVRPVPTGRRAPPEAETDGLSE